MRNRNALPALDLLVGFESAARNLSFTKAGEELFLTQSAVSRQIKELEEQLGVPLFQRRHRALAMPTTFSFAALWLIPRLAGFTRDPRGVDARITADTKVQDLERDGLDVALRHGPASLAGPNALRLFGEKVFPVCSPRLLKKKPLNTPADLRHHTLLQYDDPDVRHPWLHWKTWLEVERIADV